jgi:hypothetical protein
MLKLAAGPRISRYPSRTYRENTTLFQRNQRTICDTGQRSFQAFIWHYLCFSELRIILDGYSKNEMENQHRQELVA